MSKLYLVPTPIGNLEDMTLRAIRILKEVDLILCEDTRQSRQLLLHYDIKTPLTSFHLHNEHQKLPFMIEQIKAGRTLALISDAGTPGISDPGFLLVRECVKEDLDVETLAGATAFVPALVNSGLPLQRFAFEGFLPQKKGLKTRMESLQDEERTMIFYESPFRLLKTLDLFIQYFGTERKVSVSREISKFYEETQRGTLLELKTYFSQKTIKGEIVIILAGKED